jgi:hypothetical protein
VMHPRAGRVERGCPVGVQLPRRMISRYRRWARVGRAVARRRIELRSEEAEEFGRRVRATRCGYATFGCTRSGLRCGSFSRWGVSPFLTRS